MHAILTEHLNLCEKVLELDVLMRRFVDLIFVGRHLFLGAAIQDIDLIGAKADGGTTAVHGGEATAQNNDFFANEGWLTIIGLGQQFDPILDTFEVCTWDNLVIWASQGIGDVAASSEK